MLSSNVDNVNIPVEEGGMTVKSQAPKRPYHHGNLKAALVAAAETVLARDGLAGLTLRAAAREAGVSHAAPRNAVGDLAGLLAELAASGFERLRREMEAAAAESPEEALDALGRCYVAFALANPALFQLMFRHERLEAGRPVLGAARGALLETLRAALPPGCGGGDERLALLSAWAQVHGLAMLLLDRQLPRELADPALMDRLLAAAAVHP
jgi:AcrR family transcriptional regulator